MTILFHWNLEHLWRRETTGNHFHPYIPPDDSTDITSSPPTFAAATPQNIIAALVHPLLGSPSAKMANYDKLKPFHDPRVQLRSAHINNRTYGYIYMPRSTSAPNRGTVVLIHGFPDFSFGWRYQIPFLANLGLDVIAPDCMGYGRTDSPPHTLADYTYKRIAADLGALCQQLGLDRIILGGHDWGGAITYRVAQYHPTLVTAIFVICTPYNPPKPNYMPLPTQVATILPNFGYQLHFASGEFERECNTPLGIRQFLMNLFGARTPSGEFAFSAEKGADLAKQATITTPSRILSKDEMDFYVQEYSRHGLRGPLNWYRTQELNYTDDLAKFYTRPDGTVDRDRPEAGIEQETLFILARKDQALKPWMADKMGQKIKKYTRKDVDAGHWCMWEKPAEINEMIKKWMEEKLWNKSKL